MLNTNCPQVKMRYFARLDVLTARLLKIQTFLLVTLCRWANIYRGFETPYCLRLQCQAVQGEQLHSRCQRRVAYVDESVRPSVRPAVRPHLGNMI